MPTLDGSSEEGEITCDRDRAGVAEDVAIEASFGRVDARMRREHVVEIPGFAILCDDRARAYLLRDERRQRSPRIRDGLLSRLFDPRLGVGALHLRCHMETKSLGLIEDLDNFVGDDLGFR